MCRHPLYMYEEASTTARMCPTKHATSGPPKHSRVSRTIAPGRVTAPYTTPPIPSSPSRSTTGGDVIVNHVGT